MLTANEVRKKFLDFFASKGHTIVASDSVVPKDDPTVLFTTAGMQQFKRQFLGHIEGYTRAASSQKCLRTDDLDRVGKTAFHHTFFEMLGNFSFGDYFKKEAIEWGWEFLTKELKIPDKKLWVSVYKDDEEAYTIWRDVIKLPEEKIVKLGDKSNFWPANAKQDGPNGPCGPCSEIFFDYGANPKCTNKNCNPDCDCGRFSEVWNLVFTQYNRKEGGVLDPLPSKNIDTGMGLERLVAVVQGKRTNYETDLFTPIIKVIEKEIETKQVKFEAEEKYIIADHIRAIVFAMADGVIPSNKERGSVVKGLINNSTNIALDKGAAGPSVYKLVPVVVGSMREPYPELQNEAANVADIIKKFEEACSHVRTTRLPEFEEKIQKLKESSLKDNKVAEELGDLIFTFRDRYGLSLNIMKTKLNQTDFKDSVNDLADKKFDALMDEQQKRSRAFSKIAEDVFINMDLNLDVPKTEFLGYQQFHGRGKILKLLKDDEEVGQVNKGDHVKIILDQTPFYAEAGGQIGDAGEIVGPDGKIWITDTQKINDIFLHFGEVQNGQFKAGETIEAQVDEERRRSIMRNHTATHLLQAALRSTLGKHVQQQGSLVAEDRLRFDFTHPKALTKEQLSEIEDKINERISSDDTVIKEEMSLEEAKKKGALAFFAEKYGDRVRVVSIGDYSKEFCGGTHLDSTGEIERFIISGEGAVAQGIRRLEARTGSGADEFLKVSEKKKNEHKQLEEKKKQELKEKKTADRQRLESFKNDLETIIEQADTVNNTKIITGAFTDSDSNQLKGFYDLIKQQVPSVAVCFGSTSNGNAALIVGVSDDLIKKGIKANELIDEIAPLINGSGGGRPQLAQAGSKAVDKIGAAIKEAQKIIKEKIS